MLVGGDAGVQVGGEAGHVARLRQAQERVRQVAGAGRQTQAGERPGAGGDSNQCASVCSIYSSIHLYIIPRLDSTYYYYVLYITFKISPCTTY